MHPPPQPPTRTERISRQVMVILRFVFFLLIFYLLLSIAAGLLIPGDVVGRYTLMTERGESCSDLETRLQAFNVNQVRYRVVPGAIGELGDEVGNGTLCWLEIKGVPENGVGDAAAPLFEAAVRKADGPLDIQRTYQPRFGQVESIAVWLLSGLLALVISLRRSRQSDKDGE